MLGPLYRPVNIFMPRPQQHLAPVVHPLQRHRLYLARRPDNANQVVSGNLRPAR